MTTSINAGGVPKDLGSKKTHREFGKVGPHPLPTSLLELYSDPMFGRLLKSQVHIDGLPQLDQNGDPLNPI